MMKKPKTLVGEVLEFIYLGLYAVHYQFFNQTFYPKMIDKYFKGNVSDKLRISVEWQMMWINKYVFPMPLTLSQFITFCLSAKIRLIWKEV